jgi:predicted ester cyclase
MNNRQSVLTETGMSALAARDFDRFAALFTQDARVISPGRPDAVGHKAIKEPYQSMYSAYPDVTTAWSRQWQAEGVCILEHSWFGTNTGELTYLKMKATNRTAGARGLTICWFTPEGLIKEEHRYLDVISVAMQLGIPVPMGRPFDGLPTTTQIFNASNSAREREQLELIRQMNAALSRRELDTYLAAMDDKVESVDNTMPGSLHGKKEVRGWYEGIFEAFPDVRFTTENVWSIEDYVIQQQTLAGTHTGPLMGPAGALPPTGRAICVHSAEVNRIEDGKVVCRWVYSNAGEMATQLGFSM